MYVLDEEWSADRSIFTWCRVCLITNVKMCAIDDLRETYELLTNSKIDDDDGLPQVVCIICYSMLRKARKVTLLGEIAKKLFTNVMGMGVQFHKIEKMPEVKTNQRLHFSEITTYSNYENTCDIVSSELQDTFANVETVSDGELNLEEVYSTPEEEINDNHEDPKPCHKITILDDVLLSKDGVPISDTVCDNKLNEGSLLQPPLKKLSKKGTFKIEKSYACEICNKTFCYHGSLVNHIRAHTADKPFECNFCKKTFNRKIGLNYHMRIHTGKELFECDICKRNYIYQANLKEHMKTHSGEQDYKCRFCEKLFVHQSSLSYHIKTHNSEKPFECYICKKTFKFQYRLKSHMIIHSGNMPYECTICKKKFSHKGNFNYHLQTHNGFYECTICKKNFSHQLALKYHMKIHTGEKRFDCNYCNKSYRHKDSLISHIRIHTGEKPYECKICKKTFNHISSIRSHNNKLHAGEK